MNPEFFDSYRYRTLEPDLQALMLGARRPDAAVACVTRPGRVACAGAGGVLGGRAR